MAFFSEADALTTRFLLNVDGMPTFSVNGEDVSSLLLRLAPANTDPRST